MACLVRTFCGSDSANARGGGTLRASNGQGSSRRGWDSGLFMRAVEQQLAKKENAIGLADLKRRLIIEGQRCEH